MANQELSKYKSLSIDNVKDRPSYDLTTDESSKINTILSNFLTYFKTKHS